MYQVIFALAFILMLVGGIAAYSAIDERRKRKHNAEKRWIKDHMQEIVTSLGKIQISVDGFDSFGSRLDSPYNSISTQYRLSNMETGQQTRVLSDKEFYDLMQEAQSTKSEKLNKLLFGKYLYRQFSVK